MNNDSLKVCKKILITAWTKSTVSPKRSTHCIALVRTYYVIKSMDLKKDYNLRQILSHRGKVKQMNTFRIEPDTPLDQTA